MCRYVGNKLLIASRPALGRKNIFSMEILFTHLFWKKETVSLIWSVFVMWIDKNVNFDMLFIDDARPFLMFFLLVHNWLSVIFLHFSISFLYFLIFASHVFPLLPLPAHETTWAEKISIILLDAFVYEFLLRFCVFFLFVFICILIQKVVKSWKLFFSLHVFDRNSSCWLGHLRLAWLCTPNLLSKGLIAQFTFYNQRKRSYIGYDV